MSVWDWVVIGLILFLVADLVWLNNSALSLSDKVFWLKAHDHWHTTDGGIVAQHSGVVHVDYCTKKVGPIAKPCPHCESTMLKETRFIPDVVPGGFNTGKTKAIRYFYCGCCGKFEVAEGTEQEVATALGRSTAGDGLDFSGPEITD